MQVRALFKQGVNIIKHPRACTVCRLIFPYHPGKPAAEYARINDKSYIFAVQPQHLINKCLCLRDIKSHACMYFQRHRYVVLFTEGEQRLQHPVRDHGHQTDQADSQPVCLFDLLYQKLHTFPLGQTSVFVQIGVQKYICDHRFQTGFGQECMPFRYSLICNIRCTFQHLVREDLYPLGPFLLNKIHDIPKAHAFIQILVL